MWYPLHMWYHLHMWYPLHMWYHLRMWYHFKFMNDKLSPYLCGFRKGYNTQYCLMVVLEKWKKALDKKKVAGALLTDLSKAFDCLHHDLLIAKLEAYGLYIHPSS